MIQPYARLLSRHHRGDAQQRKAPIMHDQHSTPEPFVATEAVATFLGKPPSWVYNNAASLGLPRHKVGKHYRYRLSEVAAWVEGASERTPA